MIAYEEDCALARVTEEGPVGSAVNDIIAMIPNVLETNFVF